MEPKTIVVADDEVQVADAVKMLLEQQGYRVLTVNDGQSALETISSVRPDLAVLDIMMPWVQGLDICRYLRKFEDLRNMRVLILTALSSEHDLEAAWCAGADSFVTKPFSADSLIQEVGRLLPPDTPAVETASPQTNS